MRRTRSPPPVRAAKNNRISNEMMKNKSASHLRHRVASTQRISVSAFFNLRVLLGLFVLLASVLVVLFATSATGRTRRGEANPLGFDSGPPTARSAQTKRSSSASTSTAEALLSDLSQGCTDPMRRLAARVYRPNGFRFSPSGNVQEEWAKGYNGPGNFSDQAFAIAIDGSGNVYVTGASFGSGTDLDYTTIKYNAADGTEEWVARYNGPGNYVDIARAIAIDGSGNVYVTGESVGTGNDFDYATIKYNPADGTEEWVARYNGPGNYVDAAWAISVDGSGDVYVTGESFGSGTDYDYATIKYNPADGSEVWVVRYNGPGNFYDGAAALAIDGSGNVYVTGQSFASGTTLDYATIKYNASGTEEWVARYNGPGNSFDVGTAIAVDGSSNLYVAGESVGSGTDYDYATIKYNASGTEEWVARYNGPGNLFDHPFAIAVDGAGNVYVTGQSFGSGTDFDYATVKYNAADGAEEWIARYNGPENFVDQALAIGIDGPGNVYVTGGSMGSGTDFDYATIKYNAADGAEDWVTRYNGPGNGADAARAIAIDGSGNVYVTGESFAGAETDYATIKYSQSPGGTPTPTATPTPRPTPTSRPRPTPLPRPTPPR